MFVESFIWFYCAFYTRFDHNMDTDADLVALQRNFTNLLARLQRIQSKEVAILHQEDDEYQQLIKDLWIGSIMTILIVSGVLCSCSFFAFHKFQKWKRMCE